MSAVTDVARGVLPGEHSGWARLVEVLLVVLAIGLAFSITLSETTLLVLAVVLLARARPDAGWLRAPLLAPVLALAAWTMVTAALSLHPAESLRATRSLLTLGTFWVVLAALPDATSARRFATTIFIAVSVAACLSIVQVAGCVDGGFENTPQIPLLTTYLSKCVRAHGFFSIYMTLAGVLLVVVTVTLPRLRGFRYAFLATCAWLACVVALALTEVRGAWVGLGFGGAVIAVLGRRFRLLLLLAALPLVALLSPHVRERLHSMLDPTDLTARERVVMLHVGVRLVREHPLLGIGPAQVKRVYPAYAPPEALRRHTGHLHNTPLQIAVERGLVGLGLWLWIFVAFFARTRRILRRVPASATADRALVIGAVAAVAAFLVAGLFEYNFGDTEVLLVTLAAMALPFVVERDFAEGTA